MERRPATALLHPIPLAPKLFIAVAFVLAGCTSEEQVPNQGCSDNAGDPGSGSACGSLSDADGDGVETSVDNCPDTVNVTQADSDHDGIGDVCDNCPDVHNPGQNASDCANSNGLPTANFIVATSNLAASFTDTSCDSDGSIHARRWNFGDGGTSTQSNPSRTYGAAGTYAVTLTVTDNHGAKGSRTKCITVSEPLPNSGPPNLLFIMTDQQRFDALRRVQDELPDYNGRLKIRTPQLDRLAATGAYFRNAYSASPVCAPARSTLRTGCTIERTGVQSNSLANANIYNRMSQFASKINALESYEQLLVEEQGYVAEAYGKWHLPLRLYNKRSSGTPVISHNDYDYATSTAEFSPDDVWGTIYTRSLAYQNGLGHISKTYSDGQQENTYSKYPYSPTALDARYGAPTQTPLTTSEGYESWETSQPNVSGKNSLSRDYTSSHFNGDMAIRALDRLAQQDKPFSLTVSFHNPHAPMVAAPEYLDYYFNNRSDLFVSPSINDSMTNSAYDTSNGRAKLLAADYGYDNPTKVKEWMAGYYALVEEIDTWVGRLLDKLDEHGITDNTMVVFTSDHGEMLGAHGMREKNIFLEESAHIPLIVAFPGRIAPQLTTEEPVGHINIFATIFDYFGISHLDNSDGISLRRFIEGSSYNEAYDERTVVSEWDFRDPEDADSLTRSLGGETNFMIRKGYYKLMLTKMASSDRLDMMYNLADDPYEVNNLIGSNGSTATNDVIGKAEHLKILLVEWMQRNDGGARYYSDNKYNNGEGDGDIAEITNRRKWRTLSFWMSDTILNFGKAVWSGPAYVRNEYLYIGRTNPDTLNISNISIKGVDAGYFTVDKTSATITQNSYIRVKVSFVSPSLDSAKGLDARIEIANDVHGLNTVQIRGE